MTPREKSFYMDIAFQCAKMSYASRRKVGAVIANEQQRIVSYGWNGMPEGYDNACEDENNVSKEEVLHAELNAFMKLASSHDSCRGGTLFITMAPCSGCAKMIIQSKLKEVFYYEEYRCMDGVRMLREAGIKISQIQNYQPPETTMKNYSDAIANPSEMKKEIKRLRRMIWAVCAFNTLTIVAAFAATFLIHHQL
jgi:dCMP deaminase